VANERREPLNRTVGFRIGGESSGDNNSVKITFVTAGWLLRVSLCRINSILLVIIKKSYVRIIVNTCTSQTIHTMKICRAFAV